MVTVPGPDHEMQSRPTSRFDKADAESQGINLLRALAFVQEQHEDAPHKLGDRKVEPRRDLGQQDLGGDLADDVADLEPGDHPVELVSPEAQVLLHPRDEGIVDVVAVQVLGEEREAAERQDGEVELLHELLLLFRRPWSRPEVKFVARLRADRGAAVLGGHGRR